MSYPLPGSARRFVPVLSIFISLVLLAACGSDGNGSATPANDNTAPSAGKISKASVVLSPAQEVPALTGSAKGEGNLDVNETTGAVTGSVTFSGLSGQATAGHIHAGEAGKNGGILIALEQDPDNANQLKVPDSSVLTSDQLAELLAGKLYINIHTNANPAGEIRGQILPANISLVRVSLDGISEVPAVTTAASGVAYLTVKNDGNHEIIGNIRTTGLTDATAAHVHTGFAGLNGGILIGFEQDAADPAFWQLPAASKLTDEQFETLLSGGLYLNMHSPTNPPGELRGQIAPAGVTVLRSTLNGAFEVPANTSAGSAVVWLTVKSDTGALHANLKTSNLPDASAAHIHAGVAGLNGGIVVGLTQDATDTTLWSTAEGSVLDENQIKALNSAGLYYNVHTATTPAGEIRGQIIPQGFSVVRTVLSGDQEVPAVTTAGTGIGYTTVNQTSGSVSANIRTNNLNGSASAAHIHKGATGNNGGIVIGLTQDVDNSDLWKSDDNAQLDNDQLTTFNAGGLYFNVHTSANPPGEIRGQITP